MILAPALDLTLRNGGTVNLASVTSFRLVLATVLCLVLGSAGAAIILPGSPTSTIPSSLYDPLGDLAPLAADEFLLPIEIVGANGLQDWSFDLSFDEAVANPTDPPRLGGLYQDVYQSAFSATDLTLSNITSSGFLSPGLLQTIAGFSSGVSGDGVLAFILFTFEPGHENENPQFVVSNATVQQQVPEPATILLVAMALAAGYLGRLRDRSVG